MSNFFYTGDEDGYVGINMDLVRQVVLARQADAVMIFFDKEHTIQFEGETAKEFMDVLTRLESEAGIAVEAAKMARQRTPKDASPRRSGPPAKPGVRS